MKKITLVLLALIVLLVYCQKNNDDTLLTLGLLSLNNLATTTLGGSKTPGDVLNGTYTPLTYRFANETTGQSSSGTSTRLSSGFITLMPAGSTTNGSYAMLVPGIGLIAAPLSGYSSTVNLRAETYVDVTAAPCTTGMNLTYNVVQSAWESTSGYANYGTITIAGSPNKFFSGTLTNLGGLGTTFNSLAGGTCASGRVSFSSGETAFITTTGALILDRGTNNGALMGFKTDATLNATTALTGKTFIGFDNVKGSVSLPDNFLAYKIVCSGSTCSVTNVKPSDLTPTTIPGSMTLNLASAVNGLFTGTVTSPTNIAHTANDNFAIAAMTYNAKINLIAVFCLAGACNNASSPRTTALFTEQ